MVNEPDKYKWSSYTSYQKGNVSGEAMNVVMEYIGTLSEFKKFHKQKDENEYLEIKEDRDRFREEKVQRIITDFCRWYGIIEGKEIQEKLLKELVENLIEHSHLSLRTIAKITEKSFSTIQDISVKKTERRSK